jgi:hypothetical protein
MWIKMRDSGVLGLPITVTVGAVVETQLGAGRGSEADLQSSFLRLEIWDS